MNFKEIIQLFIPPICYMAKKYLFPKPERERTPMPKIDRVGDKMIVIGNGPSLNKTMELYGDMVQKAPCMMVNFAANTELFEILKPSIYLLVDPAYFDIPRELEASVSALFNSIVTKVHWPMRIVMPRTAQHGYAIAKFKENPNIEVLYFEDGWNRPKNMNQFEAWDKNLISPPGQTVLNTAVWLSIYWGYKETYLIGADTSWHAELKMDQETNLLYTEDTHFYDNKEVYGDEYDDVNKQWLVGTTLHEELYAEALALKDYWDLRGYADWKGVKVYNASEYSWIDAFERKKLS